MVRILLTGASGFVGSHLAPALRAAGHQVRCASRAPKQAMVRAPDFEWVEFDLANPATFGAALAGCDAAFYLAHSIGTDDSYPEREAQAARSFADAAQDVGRLIYLGGVVPAAGASKHLLSRETTGRILRDGHPAAIELRAAMIIGAGSASWTMVKDLASRLPAMVLPAWLRRHSHPIAIDDVVWALLACLEIEPRSSRIYEIPGPERITHREVLARAGRLLGRERPMLNVPLLSPRLSSYWIAMVTRIDLAMARELVEGVKRDLDPLEPILWEETGHQPMDFESAGANAIRDERARSLASSPSPHAARMMAIGRGFQQRAR